MASNLPKLPSLPGLGNLPAFPSAIKKSTEKTPPTFQEIQVRRMLRGNVSEKVRALEEFQDNSVIDQALDILRNAAVEGKDIIAGLGVAGFQVAKGAIKALAHPVDTVEAISSGRALEEFKDVVNEISEGVIEDYVDRWSPLFRGEYEEFAERTKDRPLSLLLDLSAGLSLAGGTAKTAGLAVSNRAAASGLKQVGTTLTKIGAHLDPMAITIGGIKRIGTKYPNLPLIGGKAQLDRWLRKRAQGLTVDEMLRLRPDLTKKLNIWEDITSQLSLEEVQSVIPHMAGLKVIPSSQQSEAFRKTVEAVSDVSEKLRSAYGVTDEVARRRVAFPLVLQKFKSGVLKLTDAQTAELKPFMRISREGHVDIAKFKKLEDLPDSLFDDSILGQLEDFEHAAYVPLLNAEKDLSKQVAFGRISHDLTGQKGPFGKNFTGEMANKFLKTKDPNVIADIKEVGRMMLIDDANQQLVRNVSDQILKLVNPATGESVAKPLYMGKFPTNITQFSNARDAAGILNIIKKPFKAATLDDVFLKVFGKSQKDYRDALRLTMLSKTGTKLSNSQLDELARTDIAKTLATEGFDSYTTKGGDFFIFDEDRLPFSKLLPDHVVMMPRHLVAAQSKQKALANSMIDGLDAKKTLGASLDQAQMAVFPELDDFFTAFKDDLIESSARGVNLVNDKLVDPKKFSEFTKKVRAGLKTEMGNLGFNEADIHKVLTAQANKIKKFKKNLKGRQTLAEKTGGEVSSADLHWAYQVPKEVAQRVVETVRPNTAVNTYFKMFYDSPLQAWRTAVLAFSGRWHVNNFFGNLMLNTLSGTLNPIDYARAGKVFMYRLRNEFPRQIGSSKKTIARVANKSTKELDKIKALHDVIPPEIGLSTFARAENYATSIVEAAQTPIERLQGTIRKRGITRFLSKAATASVELNSLVDQFFRDAQFFRLARGQIRQQSKGKIAGLIKSFFATDDDIIKFAKNINSKTASEMSDSIARWLPNYFKLLNPTERSVIRRIVPFYSWYKHMVSVALMMPLRHPKRAALIANIAKVGKDIRDDEFKQVGLDPKDVKLVSTWLQGTIPLGKGEKGTKFLSLRGINPFHSLVELPKIGNLLSPHIKLAIEQIAEVDLFRERPFPEKIRIGKDGDPVRTKDRALFGELVGIIPQTELLRRLVKPDVEDVAGETVFRRDRIMEVMKLLGLNINEQNLEVLKERAQKKRGRDVSRALNLLLKKKRVKDPEEISNILRFIQSN